MRMLSLLLLCALFPTRWAMGQFGPPQPRAAAQNFSLGVGVQNVTNTWLPYDYDISRNRIYFEGSYAFCESLEIFGRIGGSNWVLNDIESYEPGDGRDVSSDGYPMFFSIGVRGNLLERNRWSIGASLEYASYSSLEKTIRWDYDVYQELRFDAPTELNLGLSIAYRCGFGTLYGGPQLHFAYTRADVRTHEFGPDWDVEDDIDALTIRDKAGVGAFLGWQMPLGASGAWKLQLEGAGLSGGFSGALGFFRTL